jgi:acetyl-CoA decarbonylase/synthase complex subunit gamma
MAAKWVLLIAAAFFLLAGLGPGVYSWDRVLNSGTWSALLVLGTAVGSTVLTPVLLPWLPGRALSLKGLWLGLAFLIGVFAPSWAPPAPLGNWITAAAWCLMVPTLASFLAMGFTGATTYTSLSGVRREMRYAVPLQIGCGVVGVVLWLVGRFV